MTDRVLLVEDDDDIREAVGDCLRERGYDVVTAANGLIARDWLRSAGILPNVILLDLMMPVMDGWQFRSEQLRDGALAAIPVIILSGAGDVEKEAAALGAAGCVTKPFNLEALVGAVQQSCLSS
jgi:DNA-binding response OmpR family regulator